MRISKRVFLLGIILFLCSFPVLHVLAHSGKTDGSGGHIDHSTGEYHYHHGYPAHQHADFDGDGIIDCPYGFRDGTKKSDRNSGSSSENKNNEKSVIEDTPRAETNTGGKEPMEDWVVAVLCICAITVFSMGIYIYVLHKRIASKEAALYDLRNANIENLRQAHTDAEKALEEQASENAWAQLQIEEDTAQDFWALIEKLSMCYGKGWLYQVSGAAQGDYMNRQDLPANPNGKYIFYRSPQGIKYHRAGCKRGKNLSPINAYTIYTEKELEPCTVCKPVIDDKDLQWVDRYMQLKALLEKHIDELPNFQPTFLEDSTQEK